MSRVLIIKTSSLGDVVHNLPIVNDLLRALPGTIVDWVVEESYADLPRLHPGVTRVIPVAQRRWRRNLSARASAERQAFEELLRQESYDLVLDTQGLLKSAMLARLARLSRHGERIGFSRRLAREGLARLFYDRGIDVGRHLHAVERLRSLAAQALGYPLVGAPDFGLKVPRHRFDWLGISQYAVLLHATSRPEKAWPRPRWRELIAELNRFGIHSVLPHGSEVEEHSALGLAHGLPAATVAPRLSLAHAAALLSGARIVIGVDTGLTHLAAALAVPTVALFGATPRWRYAPYWSASAVSLGSENVQPSVVEVRGALARLGIGADA